MRVRLFVRARACVCARVCAREWGVVVCVRVCVVYVFACACVVCLYVIVRAQPSLCVVV